MLRRALALAALALSGGPSAEPGDAVPAPPFPSEERARWIGEPQSWEALRGRVVVLDVWTFGCINCVRTVPWVKAIHRRYGPRGVAVVGIHTPEFDHERDRAAVAAAVREHGLDFPHLLDADSSYWHALRNRYWPAVYLADRCGRMRARHEGEVHEDRESGRRLEARIQALLDEPMGCGAP